MPIVTSIAGWTLPEDLTAGSFARTRVREFLSDSPATDSDDLVDAAELVASELAVNAIRHGRPPATLALQRLPGRLRVEVANDPGATVPALGPLDHQESSGRGLGLVDQLATDWGWDHDIQGCITVWAEILA